MDRDITSPVLSDSYGSHVNRVQGQESVYTTHTATLESERTTKAHRILFQEILTREEVCTLKRLEEKLLVLFKFGEYRLELRKLFWTDPRKCDPESIAIDPTHHGFVDPQGPIKAWNVESAFELSPLHHVGIAFDLTPTDGNIQRPSLPLLSLSREGAPKLGRESRLDPSVFWPGLRWSLFGTF